MIFEIVSSFLAVYFTMIFEVPKRYSVYCGLAGAVNWWVYLIAMNQTSSSMLASFFASFAVAIFSQVFARILKAPVSVFLVTGILPTVPGAGIYRTVYYLIRNNSHQCTYYLLQTIQVAGAIAMAIFLTDSLFRMVQYYQSRKASIG